MDRHPFSDALSLAKATCHLSGGFTTGGAWSMQFWPSAPLKLAGVVTGQCWAIVDEQRPLHLVAGDVAVLNGPRSVILSSSPESVGVPVSPPEERDRSITPIGDRNDVTIVGGHVDLDDTGSELLRAALPVVWRVRSNPATGMLHTLLTSLADELAKERPGADVAAQQYAQLILIEVLRSRLDDVGSLPSSWLRLLADEQLAPAVRALHDDPGRPWGLAELARRATMSRSTFAARFGAVAGEPPLTYLLHWRMRLARRALRDEDVTVAALASRLGYHSDSAFSTAFRRTVGVSPRTYRHHPPASS